MKVIDHHTQTSIDQNPFEEAPANQVHLLAQLHLCDQHLFEEAPATDLLSLDLLLNIRLFKFSSSMMTSEAWVAFSIAFKHS